jgi:hypothetical protein
MSRVAILDSVGADAQNSTGTSRWYRSWLKLQNGLASLFVLFALPIVIFFAVTVPPGEVPDEPQHIFRAASILHGEIIGHRATSTFNGSPVATSGVDADQGWFTPPMAYICGAQTKR